MICGTPLGEALPRHQAAGETSIAASPSRRPEGVRSAEYGRLDQRVQVPPARLPGTPGPATACRACRRHGRTRPPAMPRPGRARRRRRRQRRPPDAAVDAPVSRPPSPARGGRSARRPRFPSRLSTWLEDAGIPAQVIDELMGPPGQSGRHQASAIGAHYRHTTPEMAAAWWLRSRSAWSSSWPRRRPPWTSNPGDAPRWWSHCASFAGKWCSERREEMRCAWWS